MIYLSLFLTFFKIGAFTFGGGYAMLPMIQAEVASHGWMTEEQLINFVAVSESTPGPFAINISTYVGTETGGFFGALCSTLGVVLPSLIVILIVARCYLAFQKNKIVAGCMSGLKSAVPGLIGAAMFSIALSVFFPHGFTLSAFTDFAFLSSVVIFGLMVFLEFKKLHPILIVLLSAVLGVASGYLSEAVGLS